MAGDWETDDEEDMDESEEVIEVTEESEEMIEATEVLRR